MPIDKDLLEQMSKDIEAELGSKKLTHVQRRALQMDRLMVMYIRQSSEDHERINRIEKTSIILWVQNNPKLAFFLLSLYVVISALVDVRDALALVMGLK